MGMAVNQQPIQGGKTSLRLLLIVLAVVLFLLPVAAVARLILATDDELDDVVAQSLLEFTTQQRTISSITLDYAILKMNAELKIDNMILDAASLGYYNGSWDIQIERNTGIANSGAIFGGAGRSGGHQPIYFRGLRLELAYTTNPAGHFAFLRIGSDDFSGVLDLNRGTWGGTDGGSGALRRISFDGNIRAITSLNIWVNENVRRKTSHTYLGYTMQMTGIQQLYFNAGGSDYNQGQTEFYITMSDYLYQNGQYNATIRNATALGSAGSVLTHLPGYGWWMHFNNIGAEAAQMW
jgi:hypothetical protein